ncbi:hypothetical protein BDR06DRAFT_296078 [Suillus hirtellus]|nr:hypothetical protein BDR06DRAFT_296078 [Suillus hirtellus]
MGALVSYVFLRHRSSVRIKQRSLKVNKDEPRPFNRLVSCLFSKLHDLWYLKTKSTTKHKQGRMITVGALHATCTFVAVAPSKILTPPVTMQFRVPDTEVCCIMFGLLSLESFRRHSTSSPRAA